MPLKGLLFDKDGTLIHFNETWNPAVLDVMRSQCTGDAAKLARLAAALEYDLTTSTFRPGARFVAGTWADYGPHWADALGVALDSQFEQDTNARLIEACARSLAPVGNPAQVLGSLRTLGVALGIATNDVELAARRQAEALGLLPHLEFIAGYDSGHGAKPEPGMIHGFARHIGAAAHHIGMVGDALHDMDAARSAGAVAIGVLTGPANRETLARHADYIVESIADLPTLLRALPA